MKDSSQNDEDVRLIHAIRAGDARSFETLVKRYQRQVANIIFLSIGDRTEIDDMTQEVFIRVHRSLPKFQFESSFFSWLYRITTNLCIDEIRRRKIKRIISLEFLADGGLEKRIVGGGSIEPSDEALLEEKKQVVRKALQKLSHEHREVMILREYEELSYQEIATMLGITIEAVKSRLFRARQEMLPLLRHYFKERT